MKQIIFFIIIIFLLVVTGNFINSIYSLWHKKDLLIYFEKQLDRDEAENKRLKAELSQVNSPQFVEEEARDKLFLIKPGEENIVIPEQDNKDNTQSESSVAVKTQNWVKWKEMFHF